MSQYKISKKRLAEIIKEEYQSLQVEYPMDHAAGEEDYEGDMAKRQMFKTAQYATTIFEMIQDGDEFPAWVQSKMTKIADYIGAVKHYLEYDHVMGEKLDPVNKEDDDVDNDGDEDSSDEYLKNRRTAVGKAMKKESLDSIRGLIAQELKNL